MLTIALETVCFFILKARAFDGKIDMVEPDSGAIPSDEDLCEVLDDYGEDAPYSELKDAIGSLNEDEQIDLVTLTWIGRGDFGGKEWQAAREAAISARSDHTAAYLLGIPLLGDYLEEGLSQLGFSCEEFEIGRL